MFNDIEQRFALFGQGLLPRESLVQFRIFEGYGTIFLPFIGICLHFARLLSVDWTITNCSCRDVPKVVHASIGSRDRSGV